jgi:hypothetical protein
MESLRNKLKQLTGSNQFFNSGVLDTSALSRDRLDFIDMGRDFPDIVKSGERINPTMLNMPPNSFNLPPHCHPSGEIAYVADGEYFDALIDGRRNFTYTKGSVIIYGAFSTHRPLSEVGARIFYIPLDGIIFPGKNQEMQAEDTVSLLSKMQNAGAPPLALDYARSWMLS